MNMGKKDSQIDVLLITAVPDELNVVRNAEHDWQPKEDSKGFTYYTRKVIGNRGNDFTIAVARPIDKGSDHASNIATRLVNELKPRCLAMVGICAGWREKVFLGDVIVAERVFRYDAGKLKAFRNGDIRKEEVFQDICTYNLNPLWVQKAQDFPTDWITTIQTKRPLSYSYQELWLLYAQEAFESGKGKKPLDLGERETKCPDWTEVLKRLEKKGLIEVVGGLKLTAAGKKKVAEHRIRYPNIPPESKKPKSCVAPMGTGSQVKEDLELFPTIEHYMRAVLAVEMEAAAIGIVAEIENVDPFIIVKGVADYADPDKDDHFRTYAIEASYRFLMAFLKENLILQSRKKVPFVLPQLDVSYFTGREGELKRLEELLLKKDEPKICSIVGLTGSGGIGKSAVACHFAELHKTDFPDGIIGLRVDGKDIDTIAREFARIYGEEIEPDDTREASTIMQDVFRHRRALLIFDNAIDSSIRSLLPGGNRCAVVITTRDRALPALLDTPQEGRIDIDILLDPDAMLLLERLLGKDRVAAEKGAAQKIIELVGNLPLGLEIVGATLQIETRCSLTDYEQSLREERDRLRKLKIRGDEHLDVRASFMLSLKLLKPSEIDFFSCLSVCAKDGFSLQAAVAANGCDKETAEETLAYLHRLSLLNYSQSNANRFVFHTLIHLFAKELAEERSLQDLAAERHAKFFIEFIKNKDLSDPPVSHFVAEELEDILLAAEWLQSQNKADYELAIKLGLFFQQHGHWRRALDLMTGFLELAEHIEDWNAVVQFHIQQAKYQSLCGELQKAYDALNPISDILDRIQDKTTRLHCDAMWQNTLGGILQRQGKFDEAVDAFKKSMVIGRKLDDIRHVAMVLNSLGSVLQRQGKFDEAVDAFQRSASIEEELGDLRGQAMVLNSLGGVLQRQGKFDEAVDAFQRSASIEEELGNLRGQAMVLNSLGGVLQRQGKFDEAVNAFQCSAATEEELGNQRGQAMVLNSLGGVFQRQGKFDEAVDAFQNSAAIEEELGDRRGQAMVLNSLGGVFQRQGEFDEAVDAFQRSAAIEEELGNQRGQAMVLNSLGGVLQRQGKFDEAVDAFQCSDAIEEELGNLRGQAMVLNSLGGVLQRQGKFDEAVDAFKKSMAIGRKLDDIRHVAMVLNSLGGVLQRQGKFDEAVDAFKHSASIEEELGNQRGQAMVLNSLGGVLQRQGKFDEAVDVFQRSYAISEKLSDERSLTMVLNSLGGVLQRQGKFDEAVDVFQRSYAISEKLSDERSLTMVLNSLGGVLQRQGKFDEAVDVFQRSYAISEKLSDERSLAMVLNSLGGVLQRQGKFDEAVDYFQKSIKIGEKLGDIIHVAMALNSFGGVLQRQGKLGEAVDAFQRSYAISEKLSDERSLAMVLNSLGGVLQRQGKLDEAVDAFQRSYAISEKLSDERSLAMVLNSLGGVLQRQGKLTEAMETLQHSLDISKRLNDKLGLAMVHRMMGKTLLLNGDIENAIVELTKSFEINEELKNKRGIGVVTTILIETLLQLNQREQALSFCQRALSIAPNNKRILKLYDELTES